MACNKEKLKQTQVEKVLFQLGDPRIFDLKKFIELSDQEKINFIFSLFPPEGDLGKINEELESIEEAEKALRPKVKAAELTISNLTQAKSDISIPAGTLAEVQKEINDKEAMLAEAREQLKEIEVQEREEKAKADAEAKAKQREEALKKQAEKEQEKAVEAAKEKGREEGKAEAKTEAQENAQQTEPLKTEEAEALANAFKPTWGLAQMGCRADLESILAIMQKAGCISCAATIKIKTLLKKYTRKEAA